jgi:hypothetical protein
MAPQKAISVFEFLGAPALIFFMTMGIILATRFISKHFITQRYFELKKEFEHWQGVRTEALNHPNPEKGKILARNIDQAELNKAYYDYFFEGMLKNIVSNVLPVLLGAAYIIKIYTPEILMDRFGQNCIFLITFGSKHIEVSSLFWYIICLMTGFILYGSFKAFTWRRKKTRLATDTI